MTSLNASFLHDTNGGVHADINHHKEKPYRVHGGPIQHGWSPYELNGGSVLAIAGDDYVVVAADMRLVRGYSILSRKTSRLHEMTDKAVLGTGGCHTDVVTLHKTLDIRCAM
jgi:20S proteasome subunit beta 6|tara:strand:+ start:51 stop:386 length:336 start_codon:yes stop_codon:yes gene_type:complete